MLYKFYYLIESKHGLTETASMNLFLINTVANLTKQIHATLHQRQMHAFYQFAAVSIFFAADIC